jgi:putative ABC transport system permease protein
MTLFSLAIRNLWGHPVRSLAVFAAVALVACLLFVVAAVRGAADNSLWAARERLGADAVVVPEGGLSEYEGIILSGRPSSFYMKESLGVAISEFPEVEALSAQLFIISARLDCCSTSDTMLVGFEPETDFTIRPWLRERLKRPLGENEIIVGSAIEANPGGRMMFYGREFLIAGKLEPTGMAFMDAAVFVPIAGARRMIAESGQKAMKRLEIKPGEVSSFLVKFKRGADAEEMAIRIEHALPEVRVLPASRFTGTIRNQLLLPVKSAIALLALEWAASLLLIGLVFVISVNSRWTELGVLRALGARRKDLRRLLVFEAATLAVSGGIAGVLAGFVLVKVFSGLIAHHFGMPFLMPQPLEIFIAGLSVFAFSSGTAFLAALWAALKAAQAEPYYFAKGMPG